MKQKTAKTKLANVTETKDEKAVEEINTEQALHLDVKEKSLDENPLTVDIVHEDEFVEVEMLEIAEPEKLSKKPAKFACKTNKENAKKEVVKPAKELEVSQKKEEVKAVKAPEETKSKELEKSKNKELEKHRKKTSIVKKISAVWTIFTTIYAIVTTGILIGRGWVSDVVSGVLIGILAVYICVFIVLTVFTFKDVKGGEKRVKIYKKTLAIFKAIANVVLLSLTAVSMVGMSLEGMDAIMKLVVFIVTFTIAVIQLGLKVTLFVFKLVRMSISKRFKVQYVKFVNGKQQKKSVALKVQERRYKSKD